MPMAHNATYTQSPAGTAPLPALVPESQTAAVNRTLHLRIAELSEELARLLERTQRNTARQDRRSEYLQAVFDALPSAVVVLDGHGRVGEATPAARQLLGEPLAGLPWHQVVARVFVPARGAGQDLTLHSGRRVTLSTCPLGDTPGQILLFQDVTEQRRLQQRLHHHQRLSDMGRMAASLAHQIRTPLASALLYASHLKRPVLEESHRLRFAARLVESLQSLEGLITNMLAFARGGTGTEELLRAGTLLEAACEGLGAQLEAGGIDCRIEDACGESWLRGNPKLLQTALHNLVANAIQAGADTIRLAAHLSERGHIQLEVADNGPGVDPALRARLFEAFETGRSEGTGLGLAVVRAVARAHGGEVYHRERRGGGSRFILELPPAVAPAADGQDAVHQQRQVV